MWCNIVLCVFSHPCTHGQAIASKRGDLKTLGKKVKPMEDLFQKFRSWLKETEAQLASLSPPSTEDPDRTRQLQQAKVHLECHSDSSL